MAKPMLVTLPFVMMLIDYWPLCRWKKETAPLQAQEADRSISAKNKSKKKQREEPVKKIVTMPDKKIFQWPVSILWEKAPFIFLAVVSSGLTIWVQTKGGAVASLQKFPFTERAANSVVSYVTYLWKAFCPINLAVFYPYQNSLPAWQIISAIFILLAISVWAIYTIKKTPYIFTGWFWYLGTMIPVIGLVQVGSQAMADRYTYLPSIGLAVMLVWWIIDLIKSEKIRKNILLPAGLVIVLVLSVLTWRQCGYWKNNFTLYEHALKVTENNDLAHYNLGNALKDQERMDEALHQYQAAVKIRPSSDGHNNIGIILELYRKEYDEAIYHYQQALKITPQDSGIHFNYGMALFNKGNLKEAIEHFRKVIELNPNYEAARRALKLALEKESGQNR
jgi:tetratricopeptide (TPR) repeat protein